MVNSDSTHRIRVVLFEGWCVGFRPLPDDALRLKHAQAVEAVMTSEDGREYVGRLGHNSLESIIDLNEALKKYDVLTNSLDAFVYIDAEDPAFVCAWRQQQERELRETKGSGTTEEQVQKFVDGYYPAYELYTDVLRRGVLSP